MMYRWLVFLIVSGGLTASTSIYAQTYDFDALKKPPSTINSGNATPPSPVAPKSANRSQPRLETPSGQVVGSTEPILDMPDQILEMQAEKWLLALGREEWDSAQRYTQEIDAYVSTHYGRNSKTYAGVNRLQAITKSAMDLHAEAMDLFQEAAEIYRAAGDEIAMAEALEDRNRELDAIQASIARLPVIDDPNLMNSSSNEGPISLDSPVYFYDRVKGQLEVPIRWMTNIYAIKADEMSLGEIAATLLKMAGLSILLAVIWPLLWRVFRALIESIYFLVRSAVYIPLVILKILIDIPLRVWGSIITIALTIWILQFSFLLSTEVGILSWTIFVAVLGLGLMSRLRFGIVILLGLIFADWMSWRFTNNSLLDGIFINHLISTFHHFTLAQWFTTLAIMFGIFVLFRHDRAKRISAME